MYERFTDKARTAFELSNQEALSLNHEYIGTEHILLGLLKGEPNVAKVVLENLEVDAVQIQQEIEKLVPSLPEDSSRSKGNLPHSPRAKKVIEFAMEEALNLSHNYVGTEHLLLGLLREREGVAALMLMNFGLQLEKVRAEVLRVLELSKLPGNEK